MARILVADGDIDNRQAYVAILEKLGHEVIECNNGTSAIEEFDRGNFGLLLIDVKLDGLDGLEVCRRIRQTPSGLQLPIIMLSSAVAEPDIIACFNCGANDYISKPINPTILTVKLKNFLQLSSLHSSEYDMVKNHVIFLNRYEITKILGYGAHSVVFLAFDQATSTKVAVKLLNRNVVEQPLIRAYLDRVGKLKEIDSSRLLRIYDFGEHNGQIYLIMEYAPEGNLKKRITIRQMNEKEAIDLAIQIVEALIDLQKHHLCHLDIKPENILLHNNLYTLTDFGMTTPRQTSTMPLHKEIWSTAAYSAPENFEEIDGIDSKSDIYSLGVTLFEAITGDNPFMSDKPAVTMFRQVNLEAPSLDNLIRGVSHEFSSLIGDMLNKKQEERPSLDNLYRSLLEIRSAYENNEGKSLTFPTQEPLMDDNQTRLFLEMTRRTRHEAMKKIQREQDRRNKVYHNYVDRMAGNFFSFIMNRGTHTTLPIAAMCRYAIFVLGIAVFFNFIGYYCYGAFQQQDAGEKSHCKINTMCTRCDHIATKSIKTIRGDHCSKCGAPTGFLVLCKSCKKKYPWIPPETGKGVSYEKSLARLKEVQTCKYCSSTDISYVAPDKGGVR